MTSTRCLEFMPRQLWSRSGARTELGSKQRILTGIQAQKRPPSRHGLFVPGKSYENLNYGRSTIAFGH